jgi:hypothetical protein
MEQVQPVEGKVVYLFLDGAGPVEGKAVYLFFPVRFMKSSLMAVEKAWGLIRDELRDETGRDCNASRYS